MTGDMTYPNQATLQGTIVSVVKNSDATATVTIQTPYTLESVKLLGALLQCYVIDPAPTQESK